MGWKYGVGKHRVGCRDNAETGYRAGNVGLVKGEGVGLFGLFQTPQLVSGQS